MKIQFISLHIHHFLSFNDATIDLSNRGYCLISGINKNPKDAARSNGAGKSTIANAIAFCLLGETLNGLKSNLANNYYNDGCYVELEFNIDGKEYKLLRSKDDKIYGTNLKILANQEDKSGKGIRESQAILDELLPDLTRELVGSVILLGQGLPDKFTNNSPSGRKEVLEHLSKSDFMIQDLKDRVERRESNLSSSYNNIDKELVSLSSSLNVYTEQFNKTNDELNVLLMPQDFDSQINQIQVEIDENTRKKEQLDVESKKLDASVKECLDAFSVVANKRQDSFDKIRLQHDEIAKEFASEYSALSNKIVNLEDEIKRLESIKDVCPTCGQKIPGAIKPDTTKQRILLEELNKQRTSLSNEISQDDEEYEKTKRKISETYDDEVNVAQQKLTTAQTKQSNLKLQLNEISQQELLLNSKMLKVKTAKETHEQNINRVKDTKQELQDKINSLNDMIVTKNRELESLSSHIEVVRKMSTYLKRDFRGVLLQNSIDYINKKAKEYASKIFNTDEITFELNGNDIDITYCSKDYDNLSGGEKQRVDLITQFAIRQMLSEHLNFSSNILFLDEITDNLDKDSCDRVIDFITQELKDIESVFIISHHSDLEIPVDSEIIVEKNIYGVSEVL